MPNAVKIFTGNHILNVSILAFLAAQFLKVVFVLLRYKKIDFRRLLGAGGMPSSHSAIICACAASIGKTLGIADPLFALAAVVAFVVMYDASNVRRAAGEQAKILNYMMEHWPENPELFGKQLKELLGHTRVEVFAGAALGIALGALL